MKRTDNHRPSVLNPLEYVEVLAFAYPGVDGDKGFAMETLVQMRRTLSFFDKGNGKGGCDCCGANFRFGSVMHHEPTGVHIVVGHTCADKIGFLTDADNHAMIRRTVRENSLRARARRERYLHTIAWARANKSLVPLMKLDHPIVRDIRDRLVRKGWEPSEKQVALVQKLNADAAVKVEERHVPVPASEKRQTIEGWVVSVKTVDTDYGTATKIIVKVETPEGSWLCYGTEPSGLFGVHSKSIKGCMVRFAAVISAGGRDPHFGFFKRPTKPELVAVPWNADWRDHGVLERRWASPAAFDHMAKHGF